MMITLDEARALYNQGGTAKEIALRAYPEGEILNDYKKIIKLPEVVEHDLNTNLYAKLCAVYKAISEGRIVNLTSGTTHLPKITLANPAQSPRYGKYSGKISIDGSVYSIYISTELSTWDGKLGFENDGVYMGSDIFRNKWAFKEKAQAEHFVELFFKELIQVGLGDLYTVKFIPDTNNEKK